MNQLAGKLHGAFVFGRRMQAIAHVLLDWLPAGKVLDYGAGNGALAAYIMEHRPDVSIVGVDVHSREETYIPITIFDGSNLPFETDSFDAAICVDVLHHIDEPTTALRELHRICKGRVMVKDHFYRNQFEWTLLRLMDWVGNNSHGVYLPYNYFSRESWQAALTETSLEEVNRIDEVPGQYPQPAQQLLGRNLQFVAELVPK